MNQFRKLKKLLKQHGISGLFAKVLIITTDYWFDFKYRTDTRNLVPLNDLAVAGSNKRHGHRYEPARAAGLRKVLPLLRSMASDDDTFVDLGSGKGRVLMLAAEAGFKRVKGIEFAGDLCRIAESNCRRYRNQANTACEFEIIETDAAAYHPSQSDTVFFMFNPFDAELLGKVLGNIEASVASSPRPVFICYYNPAFGDSAEDRSGFKLLLELNYWGYRFKVYSNTTEETKD